MSDITARGAKRYKLARLLSTAIMVRSFGFNPLQNFLFRKFCLFVFLRASGLNSFAKVNCEAREHFSRLFFVQSCEQYFSFPCCYVIKELVRDLAVLLSSYGCTREVWRARGKRKSCSRR